MHTPSINPAVVPKLTTLTQQGKIHWQIVTSLREREWELADACNIIEGHRNGISLRFCQGRCGDYFLHLLNAGFPIRLSLPKIEAEILVQEIAKTIPALKQAFDELGWWTTQGVHPKKENTLSPKKKSPVQRLLHWLVSLRS